MQIAKFQTGTADLCQVVTIDQEAANLFTVRSVEQIEGEASEAKFARFVNARLAFDHALRLIADEVDDICDTMGEA